MKKYKRKIPLISPRKIAMAALYTAIATAALVVFSDSDWSVVLGGLSASLLIFWLLSIIDAGGRYRYSKESVEVIICWSVCYRKLKYSRFDKIVISNAEYRNSHVIYNCPMQYKSKGKNSTLKVTFPYITLHEPYYPVSNIKRGMNSENLRYINDSNIYHLGICWFDSLQELLEHSDSSVYVLEDVYLRFKGQFDIIFSQYNHEFERFYIITDNCIAYKDYG